MVLDDDPTGTQTVHGVAVYMDWEPETLESALAGHEPVFFVSTNSRGLAGDDAKELALNLGRRIRGAAMRVGLAPRNIIVASRSDSTLRGHFPTEVDGLIEGFGEKPDGILLVPAFFEGGRYTIGNTHWVDQGGTLVEAHTTEFARDPDFGYHHSDLPSWIEEKTAGRIRSPSVQSISLEVIRDGGPEEISKLLMGVADSKVVVINAACYEDLEAFSLGLADAEERGKWFLYRCAASIVKARGGFDDKPLITRRDLPATETPGMVVVGSYVDKTTRQLDELLKNGGMVPVEIDIHRITRGGERTAVAEDAARLADKAIAEGRSPVLFTTRGRLELETREFLQVGKTIMATLCDAVNGISRAPSFLIAKGGITSIEVARTALNARQALVLGQILKGVPVWKLGPESMWPGVPYVVFPGNVGDEKALCDAYSALSDR